MKIHNGKIKVSVLALAVLGALATMSAYADDEEAAALKAPSNFVDVGVLNVTGSSNKFGEYNGLNKSGQYLDLNFSVRGGSAYTDNENGSTLRWGITGVDLGTGSGFVGANLSDQGNWNIGASYDQLTHNTTTNYQTPYQNTNGGAVFSLPANFGTIPLQSAVKATNGSGLFTPVMVLSPAEAGDYHTLDVNNTRNTATFAAGLNLTPHWSVNFDVSHLDESGAKLMALSQTQLISPVGTPGANAGSQEEAVFAIPYNYKTDNINLGLNWTGEKANFSVGYYGSFFTEESPNVQFETFESNVANSNFYETYSTPPSNQFHQINLSGGYLFQPGLRFTGDLSYSRNTQDAAYIYDAGMISNGQLPAPNTTTPGTTPVSSLSGLVVNTNMDFKLTDQFNKDLNLLAQYKRSERNDETPSNVYNFIAIDGATDTGWYPNAPLSNSKSDAILAGDYRVTTNQQLHLGYTHENITRWCDSYASSVAAGYPANTECVVDTASREDKVDFSYRIHVADAIIAKLGYVYSDRTTNVDPYAITMFGATNNAGIRTGLNGGDFTGYYPFFDASRREEAAKFNISWQATEKLSATFGAKYTNDTYPDSTYGVQGGHSSEGDLDLSYAFNDKGSLTFFASVQNRERGLTTLQKAAGSASSPGTQATSTSAAYVAGGTWSNQLTDKDTTFGLAFKQAGLMSGKVDLLADLTYSAGTTNYNTVLNYNSTNAFSPYSVNGVLGAPATSCSSAYIETCGSLPNITSTMKQLRVSGAYHLTKQDTVVLRATYQRLDSNDYYYNGYAVGYSPTSLLPSNQQSPSYSISVVGVNYVHKF